MYDVVVAGGSIAGLCCAREAALGGCSVLVIEDDAEVGTPDHCGGMVSVSALQRLQVTPRIKMSSHKVHTAKIFSPSGYSVSFDAKAQNVISIDRRELDKEIARQAQKAGAVVRIKTKYVERTQDGIRTGSEEIACKEFVDARGIGPLAKSNPSGIIPCCQCEVHADWIESRTVEVHMDAVKYPGFFAWVIPSGKGHGKIGVAGIKIDPIAAMETVLKLRVPKLDMLVGMGLYSTDTPGTGGSIKEKREDFAVNEVLAEKTLSRIAENTGYAVYKLDKNGIDTNHALAEVQKRTGVRLKALGLKDSRAVTSQYVCATSKMAKISKYDGGRFSIKQIGFSKRPLTAKDMIGNRFSIRVSGTDADLSEFNVFVKF